MKKNKKALWRLETKNLLWLYTYMYIVEVNIYISGLLKMALYGLATGFDKLTTFTIKWYSIITNSPLHYAIIIVYFMDLAWAYLRSTINSRILQQNFVCNSIVVYVIFKIFLSYIYFLVQYSITNMYYHISDYIINEIKFNNHELSVSHLHEV